MEERLGRRPEGPIRLLTHLRTLGHCFNPVSFYYCFAPDGDTLEAIVAEVTNTPWGERHAYVLEAGNRTVNGGDFDKALHVSPFMPMDQRYTLARPGAREDPLGAHREHAGRPAGVRRHAQPDAAAADREGPDASPRSALIALIYGHGVALKLKGVPIQPHPAR